ncbi:MAG: hypothetical protein IPN17_28235 [Deltaproteobacteria bacterium]|jgi:hypothetical protein|nr:hypothetical protein [Deltaproteobacteria bacterium]MBK7066885.1 hypothetical protein [Deltaproteobacteria bacterium]MBK8696045.1 hypothetical protein [Deltaproteobacteria bacterium]MBP6829470.1 hypothetical protein [Deltaproteobacteria bacterium]
MRFLVPCTPDGASRWTQTSALDGVNFVLTFDWNQRMGRWALSLADSRGVAIRSGMILNVDVPLLRGVVDTRRPRGELVVMDASGVGDLDPGFSDLGSRFLLLYLDAAELGR